MNDGFISIHRKMWKNWVWISKNSDYLKLWIHFLLRANYKDNKIVHERKIVIVKRGDFITSLQHLSDETSIGIQVIRDFLKLAEEDGMIINHHNTKKTHITICNYDSYQLSNENDNTIKTQRKHDKNTIVTTINKDNKNNKDNNSNTVPLFEKSEEEEVVLSSEGDSLKKAGTEIVHPAEKMIDLDEVLKDFENTAPVVQDDRFKSASTFASVIEMNRLEREKFEKKRNGEMK